MGIQEIVEALKQAGFFSFFLPFILMFAIFYALLAKSKIFGDPKDKTVKRINSVVSLIASFFVLAFSPLVDIATFLSVFFGQLFMILTSILGFLILAFMIIPAEDWEKNRGKYLKIIAPICALIAVGILLTSWGYSFLPTFQPAAMPKIEISDEDLLTLLLILGIIFVIWFVTREEKKEKTKKRIIGYRPEPIYEGEA